MSTNHIEYFGVGTEVAEELAEAGTKEVAESAAKEGGEALAKEIGESASKEAGEEAAEEAGKKSLSETLKDGAKSLGEKVYKNPLKSLGAAGLAGTGIAALINKKSFGTQLGEEVRGGTKAGIDNILKPGINDILKPVAKTFMSTIMDFLKATFGPAWNTVKWVLLSIGVLIVIFMLWQIIHLIKG
jgi:hypothetical protein